MIGSLAGLGYGAFKHKRGYQDAMSSVESGDTSELYEEISDFLDDYTETFEKTSEIYDSRLNPGISNDAQAAFGILGVKNPGRMGKRMGQIKALNDMDKELNELVEDAEPYGNSGEPEGSVEMEDVQTSLSDKAKV